MMVFTDVCDWMRKVFLTCEYVHATYHSPRANHLLMLGWQDPSLVKAVVRDFFLSAEVHAVCRHLGGNHQK